MEEEKSAFDAWDRAAAAERKVQRMEAIVQELVERVDWLEAQHRTVAVVLEGAGALLLMARAPVVAGGTAQG